VGGGDGTDPGRRYYEIGDRMDPTHMYSGPGSKIFRPQVIAFSVGTTSDRIA